MSYVGEFMEEARDRTKFERLLLMVRIEERDIYEAFRVGEKMTECAELRVLLYFVEGVINLMRRNYNEGIAFLESIKRDLGF